MKKDRMMLLILVLVWNQIVYNGAMFLTRDWYHYNLETFADSMIPFLPWTVSIYFACYLFWVINYVICVRMEKGKAYQFVLADLLAKTVCLICFLALPTTNVRPEILGNSFWEELMRLLYQIDSASNLFPSIHCLVSWFCFIGVRGKAEIPRWYQGASLFMAAAVFLSTLTTKQHVIVDVIAGVLLAEVSYKLAGRIIRKLPANRL